MNEHITKYLEHYLTIEKPQYAILLSGKWGSGKTFFIDEFAKSKQSKDKKFIKVSLFGLKNISEVNNQIIFQLLNIKKRWFIPITKAIQPFTKKLNLPIQDLPIDKIFKESGKKLIFIFDDLERSNVKYSEILGYINYFVEQSGFKVIILADEENIKDKEFIKFKEKVIGKTFEVQQDFNAVLDVFLKLATHSEEALRENKQRIKTIYDKAGYNNLRHIRQTILYFDYFYSHIEYKFTTNNGFLTDLISLFFAFSIEVKKGELKVNDISEPSSFAGILDNKEKTNFEKILDKYPSNSNFFGVCGEIKFLIGKENWGNILFKGNIIKDNIDMAISNSPYFSKDNRESWVSLWHFYDLEDDEFKTILADVEEKFKNNEYLEHGKLLHVTAILLSLSKREVYSTKQADILKQAKANIDASTTAFEFLKQDEYLAYHAPYSLCYVGRESNEFQEIIECLNKKSRENINIGLRAKSDELLQDFKNNDIDILKEKLTSDKLDYVAIFSQINVNKFIDVLLEAKHNNLYGITNIIKQKYEYYPKLTQDLEFWQGVDKSLLGKIDKNKYPVKHLLMVDFKDRILKDIITYLEKQASE